MNWLSWRPFNNVPPMVALWLGPLSFVLVVVLLTYPAWLFVHGAAAGVEDRYIFIFVFALLLQRFWKPNGLKPSTTKRIVDVFLIVALAMCVGWYVRTGGARPFGLSVAIWYAGAYAVGLGTGFFAERLHAKRAASVSN